MDEVKILELLSKQYGIDSAEIMPGPRQFLVETFIVNIKQRPKFFLKVIPKTDFPRKIIKSLPALEVLVSVGLENISNPINTNEGNLFIDDNNFIYALFSYIRGKQTFNYDNRLVAEFLAQLHKVAKKVEVDVEVETFSSYVDELFPKSFNSIFQDSSDSVVVDLQKVLNPYRDELQADWEKFKGIANDCKQQASEMFVITHGDVPGNIIVDERGKIFVIDWDDIMLAPPERDLWFLKENREFMDSYLQNNPTFVWNDKFYAYYVLWRNFDDLFGWMGEILSNKSKEHKVKNLEDLKKDYFEWLRPLVRKF